MDTIILREILIAHLYLIIIFKKITIKLYRVIINFIDNTFLFLINKFNFRNNFKSEKIVIILYESFTLSLKKKGVSNKVENIIVIA